MFLFGRNDASKADRKQAAHIEAVVRSILDLEADAIVRVLGRHCADQGCGQTTILLARPNVPTQALGVDKPINDITEADLRIALQPPREARNHPRPHLEASQWFNSRRKRL